MFQGVSAAAHARGTRFSAQHQVIKQAEPHTSVPSALHKMNKGRIAWAFWLPAQLRSACFKRIRWKVVD